jgi:hypothetical protein
MDCLYPSRVKAALAYRWAAVSFEAAEVEREAHQSVLKGVLGYRSGVDREAGRYDTHSLHKIRPLEKCKCTCHVFSNVIVDVRVARVGTGK